jgi:hypothetical protein
VLEKGIWDEVSFGYAFLFLHWKLQAEVWYERVQEDENTQLPTYNEVSSEQSDNKP